MLVKATKTPSVCRCIFDARPERFGHLGPGFQSVQVRVVMEDARGDSGQRRQDQVGFGRMKIAAGRIHAQSPRVSRNGFPRRKPEGQLKEDADGFAGKILEGIAAPFIQSQVLARGVFLQQRKLHRRHSFIGAEWIGLIGPVKKSRGPRITMKMMLGLLVIKQRLGDCQSDLSFHSRAIRNCTRALNNRPVDAPSRAVLRQVLPRRVAHHSHGAIVPTTQRYADPVSRPSWFASSG